MDVDRLKARRRRSPRGRAPALLDRTPAPKTLYERAVRSMPERRRVELPGGRPLPRLPEAGQGSRVWDVDGTEYIDFHGGFGVNVVGHAHPKIVEAIQKARPGRSTSPSRPRAPSRSPRRSASASSCEQMRFVNSGTEATMDAIRVARAATGRDKILKMEGSYHGHHDSVLFSVVPESDVLGLRHNMEQASKALVHDAADLQGHPSGALGHGHRRSVQRRGGRRGGLRRQPRPDLGGDPRAGDDEHRPRCAQARLPPGAARRVRTTRRGADLRRGQVRRDDRLRRARPSGTASGRTSPRTRRRSAAAPRSARSAARPVHGAGRQGRRPAGNVQRQPAFGRGGARGAHPGADAATRTTTSASWERCSPRDASERSTNSGIPAHAVDLGAKGCVSYRKEPLTNYRDFLETIPELFYASFPWMMNRGIFMTPGDEEQWTISVQHTEEDIQHYIDEFGAFCSELVS